MAPLLKFLATTLFHSLRAKAWIKYQLINTFIRAEMKQSHDINMTPKIQHQEMAKMTMRSSKSTTTCYQRWAFIALIYRR